MMIQQQGFKLLLPHPLPRLILINGTDPYLGILFKHKFKQIILTELLQPHEHKRLYVHNDTDWLPIFAELNSYSILAEACFLEITYNKTIFTQKDSELLQQNLIIADPKYFILVYMPHIHNNALKFLTNLTYVGWLAIKVPQPRIVEQWIVARLEKNHLQYPVEIPALIYRYTQGNLLACAQLIAKMSLSQDIK